MSALEYEIEIRERFLAITREALEVLGHREVFDEFVSEFGGVEEYIRRGIGYDIDRITFDSEGE